MTDEGADKPESDGGPGAAPRPGFRKKLAPWFVGQATAAGYLGKTNHQLPLYGPRKLISEWVLPLNNLAALTTNVIVLGVADFFKARWAVLPWLVGAALVVLASCLVLQSNLVPSLSQRARKGRLAFMMRPVLPGSLLVFVLVGAAFAAYASNKPRGALAAAVPSLQSLQDAVFGVQAGVTDANRKLVVLMDAQAAHQAAIDAQPASLGVVDLSVTDNRPDGVGVRAVIFLNVKSLAAGQATFAVKASSPDGGDRLVDLSRELAAAGGSDAQLALTLPATMRRLTTCLGAPFPSASQPHVVVSSYTFDPAGGVLAQKGPTTLVVAAESPCAR